MDKQAAITALSALAHDGRLDAFRLLVEAGERGLPAGALGEALAIPHPVLSFHLNQLKQAGLARAERRGRQQIYRANFATMTELLAFLTRNCCRGVPAAPGASTPCAGDGDDDDETARSCGC